MVLDTRIAYYLSQFLEQEIFLMFYSFTPFLQALKSTGLRTSDPRLKECMDMLRLTLQTTSDGVMLDKDLFKK